MKNLKLIAMFTLLLSMLAFTQSSTSSDVALISETIHALAKAADENDVPQLEKHLDTNFRIIMNRQFGSKEVTVMTRSVYLGKIKSKEFGGDDRTVTIENVVVNGPTASAQVTFAGSKMTFVSLLTLVKSDAGEWKLVSEVPVVQ